MAKKDTSSKAAGSAASGSAGLSGSSDSPSQLNSSTNVVWEEGPVKHTEREKHYGHKAAAFWFTGLSGSGKSTIAMAVERMLHDAGLSAYRLDGDNVRHGLNGDLGFSPEDREENIRRIGHVSRLFHDAGLIVLCTFISPYRKDRDAVRALYPKKDFHEVYVACDVEECKKRDPKGLYKKAETGEIKEFTGVSSPYEAPENAELTIDTGRMDQNQAVKAVYEYILKTVQTTVRHTVKKAGQ